MKNHKMILTLAFLVFSSASSFAARPPSAAAVPPGNLYVRTVNGQLRAQSGTIDPVGLSIAKARELCLSQHAMCYCHSPIVTEGVSEHVQTQVYTMTNGFGDVEPVVGRMDTEQTVTHADDICDGYDSDTYSARLNDCDDEQQLTYAAAAVASKMGAEVAFDGNMIISDMPLKVKIVQSAPAFNQNWCTVKFTEN